MAVEGFFWINNSVNAAVTVALFFSARASLQRAMAWPLLDELELDELELEELELELEELELDEDELEELVLPELELELVFPELELELELEVVSPVPVQASSRLERIISESERIMVVPLYKWSLDPVDTPKAK
ncbi:MAG: hypothetical protein RL497_1318 [Pseudomonadota bacterium]|jgi:hypothetical protein